MSLLENYRQLNRDKPLIVPINGDEDYSLTEDSLVSSSVYDINGKLLRNLETGVLKTINNYKVPEWDGLDNEGNNVTSQGYEVKVTANNITFEWEGVIGNSSKNITGEEIWRGQHFPNEGLTIGDKLYVAYGANEGDGVIGVMPFNDYQVNEEIMFAREVYPSYTHLAYDGVDLYFAGTIQWRDERNLSFVSSSKINTILQQSGWNTWSGDTVDNFSQTYPVGDLYDDPVNLPKVTGLAVQTGSQNMYCSRGLSNLIRVTDKTTGVLKLSITNFTNPKLLKIDNSGFLWFVHGALGNETLEKFTINNTTGAITTTGLTLTGLNNVRALTFNNTNTEILLADANTFSQVISYSTTDLSQQWVLGRAESYTNDSTVYNDKFLFTSYEEEEDRLLFLAYEPDGSLWVNDFANERFLKFDTSRNYVDQVIWKSNNYHVEVDSGSPTRVFSDFKEYSVDYSLPIRESWQFVKNWATIEKLDTLNINYSGNNFIRHIETMSNGRTYALIPDSLSSNSLRFIEFGLDNTLRDTGVTITDYNNGRTTMKSGGLIGWGLIDGNGDWNFYRRFVTGFDASNNPILSAEELVGTIDTTGRGSDYPVSNFPLSFAEYSSNGVLPLFGRNRQSESGKYHLAGFKAGGVEPTFRTAKGFVYDTNDPYPLGQNIFDDRFVTGIAGSAVVSVDNLFLWGYSGEGFKASQANYLHLLTDDGMFLLGAGTEGALRSSHFDAIPEMAGNAFSLSVVKIENDIYLYQNDENWHGGLHRWKISNLESINEISILI